jgi:hypothetical protein
VLQDGSNVLTTYNLSAATNGTIKQIVITSGDRRTVTVETPDQPTIIYYYDANMNLVTTTTTTFCGIGSYETDVVDSNNTLISKLVVTSGSATVFTQYESDGTVVITKTSPNDFVTSIAYFYPNGTIFS